MLKIFINFRNQQSLISILKDLEIMRLIKVATCNLNQWAMDFDNNLANIKESITKAKEAGATIRLGSELEITGYGCEDHFLELDTFTHSWECLKDILVGEWTDGILCSIGMPIMKGSERYNCQVFCMNRKIIMVRPKMRLVNVDNFMEARWFKAWQMSEKLVDFQLPIDVSEAISQKSAPFGYGFIQFLDTAVAAEVCRELFSTFPPHDDLAHNGVEVFLNASGSSYQVGKAINFRLGSLIGVTQSIGGVYIYSNQRGCDGGRLYYDGCSCILVNGEVVALGSQFSLKDVEVMVAQVDLDKVAAKRTSSSAFLEQESGKTMIPSIAAPYKLCKPFNLKVPLSTPIKISPCSPEEEIALGPACWMWDYLRRSEACGFLLPLSGGPDSSSVAAIVGSMCQLVIKEIEDGNEQVKADAIRIGCYTNGQFPTDTKEFANRIFYTIFMGSENSCESSRKQAKDLAQEIGSWHLDVSIDTIVSTLLSVIQKLVGKQPQNKAHENRGLNDIQARIRMVLAHALASTLPWVHNKSGFYLVLSSSNADDELFGKLTKYGCSSGDLNPIGTINKQDIQAFLQWAAINLGYSSLANFCTNKGHEIAAETTNDEQSIYGKWRRNFRCGPVSMFQNLCHKWASSLTPSQVAERVKNFFENYSINRHKMTVLTPSCHVERYSPDDNRCDLRQFLYNTRWPYQFRKIDQLVQELQGSD